MIAWIDGSAGASGDMLLGALVDVGVPLDVLRAPLDRLDLGICLRSEDVTRASLAATRVHVDVDDTSHSRHLPDVVGLLSRLDPQVRDPAVAVFTRLADAEAAVHRIGRDEVHFHEVGALDSIADVVAVCAGFVHLACRRVVCSTLHLGNGTARSAHGPIPVPVPAVVALLTGLAPVAAGPAPFEATTPTGAALLAHWVDDWGPMPAMTIESSGSGAGARDLDEIANALRIVRGTATASDVGTAPSDQRPRDTRSDGAS